MLDLRRSALGLLAAGLLACPAQDQATQEDKAPGEKPKTAGATPGGAPAAGEMPEIALPPGTGPAAVVNGKDVPRDTFNAEYKQTLERYYRARHDVKPPLMERLKDNIVRRLVDAELIRQKAEELSVSVPADEMQTKWSKHKERYGSEEGFQAFLERAGTTAADVERQFRGNLLREKVFQRVSEEVTVSAVEIRKFYDDNTGRFEEPERIKASHVLVKIPKDADQAAEAAAKAKAQEALKKIKGGADFAAVAAEYSDDSTKRRGGDLGFFVKGRMVKPFEEAAWKLKKGKISGLVRTRFGFHIIKKTDHQPARKRDFDDVKSQIERSLEARARNQAIRSSLENWRKEAKIDIRIKGDPAIIEQGRPPMPKRPGQPGAPTIDVSKMPKPTTNDAPTGQ